MQVTSAIAALDAMARGLNLRNRLPARMLSTDPKYLLFFRGDLISDEYLMKSLLQAIQGENFCETAVGVYSESSRSESWVIPVGVDARVASLAALRRQWISGWPRYCSDHCVVADKSESWLIYFDPLEDFGFIALYEAGNWLRRQIDGLHDLGCFSLEDVGAHVHSSVASIQLRSLQKSFLEQLEESYKAK